MLQGEPKKIRKVKNGQLLNLSRSKLQNLVKLELFRLEQWGMYGATVEDSSPCQRGLVWKKIASEKDTFFWRGKK